jgi:hypothetical protein
MDPERFDANVTRRPSGGRLGVMSRRVDEMAMTGGEAAAPVREHSMRQMFASLTLRT